MPDLTPNDPAMTTTKQYDFSELFIRDEGDGKHICLNQANGCLAFVNETAAKILDTLRRGISSHAAETDNQSIEPDARQLLESLERRKILRRRTP